MSSPVPSPIDSTNELVTIFKIYGLFRSGTNLVKLLIERHTNAICRANIGGQKHIFAPVNWDEDGYTPDDTHIVLCVKQPHAAMVSLYRYAQSVRFRHFDCPRNWPEFLTSRFVLKLDHPSRPPAFLFRSPVDYWNAHTFHFLSFGADKVTLVKYEDVLNDPKGIIERLTAKFPSVRLSTEDLVLPSASVLRMGEVLEANPVSDQPFDSSWYTLKKFMNEFSREQLEYMSREIDPALARQLGY